MNKIYCLKTPVHGTSSSLLFQKGFRNGIGGSGVGRMQVYFCESNQDINRYEFKYKYIDFQVFVSWRFQVFTIFIRKPTIMLKWINSFDPSIFFFYNQSSVMAVKLNYKFSLYVFSQVFLKGVVNKDIINQYTNKAAKFTTSSNLYLL